MITTLLRLLRLFPFLCGVHRQLALENLALRHRPISAGSYAATSLTTTPRGHTNRSTTTVPSHESWNPRPVAASSRFRRLAGSIIAISGSPDRRRVPDQPPLVRVIQHAADGAMWRSRLGSFPTALMITAVRDARTLHAHAPHPCAGHENVGLMGFLTRTRSSR